MSPDNTYTKFKEELEEKTRGFPRDVMENLIKLYDPVIGSKRRSSCIKNCSELISVLEKRDYVKSDDFSKLSDIVERLPNSEDRDRMLSFLRGDSVMYYGHGQNIPRAHDTERAATVSFPSKPSITVTTETVLSSRVIDCIAKEIGKKWRDLARKLKLREGELDRIEAEQHPQDWRACAYESLVLYQGKCNNKCEMEDTLLKALEKARRQDLRNEVQKLLASNSR